MFTTPFKTARSSRPFVFACFATMAFIGGCANNQIDQIRTGSISKIVNESIPDARGEDTDYTKKSVIPVTSDRNKAWSSFKANVVKTPSEISNDDRIVKTRPKGLKSGRKDLTLKDVIAFTLATNPEIIIARAQLEDARIGIDIEKADYHPQVDLTLSTGRENTHTSSTTAKGIDRDEASVSVRQTLFDFGAIGDAVGRREALYDSAILRKADAEEEIVFNTLKSYMDYLRQTDLVASSARNVAAHKKIAKLVRISQEGGNSTVADVKRVETRLDAANSQKISNDSALKNSTAAFHRVTELNPHRIKRPGNLVPSNSSLSSSDVNSSIKLNPKLQSLAADQLSLEQQFKQQRASIYPKIFALGEANYKSNVGGETGVTNDAKVMLVLQMKLYDGGRKRKTAEQIEQRILEADARHQKLYRELAQNFKQNKEVLSANRKKAKFLQNGVASAKKVTNLYTQQFQGGTRSPFELLDAQRDLHRAEQEVINHRYDSALARYNTLRLRGELVGSLVNRI